jgi:hypothetical protein
MAGAKAHRPGSESKAWKDNHMLWAICVVLIILWPLGLVTGTTMGGLVHIILVIAIIVVLVSAQAVRRFARKLVTHPQRLAAQPDTRI